MAQNKIHSNSDSLEFQIQFLNFLLTLRDQSWDAFEPMNGKITAWDADMHFSDTPR